MHRALEVKQIQSHIFSYLPSRDDSHLLFCLAVSCKTLSENALKLLWGAPPDLGVLIHTMPPDLWREFKTKTGKKYTYLQFTRPLKETDWDRFNYYAPMIRIMRFKPRIFSAKSYPLEYVSIQIGVYSAFNDYASKNNRKSFLPRLRSAIFLEDKDHSFTKKSLAHLGCFLSSELESLEVQNPRNAKIYAEILAQHPNNNITSLIITGGDRDEFMSFVSPLLPKLTTISGKVSCDGESLGNLPSLKSIRSLLIDDYEEFSSFTTEGGRFPNLTDLEIRAYNWKSAGKLLKDLQCGFHTLDILLKDTDDNTIATSYGFRKLTRALGSNTKLSMSLTTLTFRDKRGYEVLERLCDDTWQPLLSLKALRHLIIDMYDIGELNDDWLAEGALAWPHIRTLDISAYGQLFTLKGLVPLLIHCPHIRKLKVHPSVLPFDLSLLPSDDSAANHNIKGTLSLHKAKSTDVNPPEVFACIKAMFPNVTDIERADENFHSDYAEYWEQYPEDRQNFDEKWDELLELFEGG